MTKNRKTSALSKVAALAICAIVICIVLRLWPIYTAKIEVRRFAEVASAYRARAEQGDPKSQYALGLSYARGEGVSQDYSEAVRWYRKAAEQGYAPAQYGLGFSYALGQGVSQDYAQAV